jgi:hypothetical protein
MNRSGRHSVDKCIVLALIASVLFLTWSATASAASPLAQAAHATISEYNGPATCIACHQVQAEGMFGSVHYQLSGPTPNVTNIPGDAGKGNGGFNTYSGTPESSPFSTCADCHVGNGAQPSPTMTADQLNNIDCLLCHQPAYKRIPVPAPPVGDFNLDRYVDIDDLGQIVSNWLAQNCTEGAACGPVDLDLSTVVNLPDFSIFSAHWLTSGQFRTEAFTDYLGTERTCQIPGEDEAGNFQFAPDADNMAISILEAARTVDVPTRAACLRCHARAGGGDGTKRGDISSVSANPPLASDIHMSAAVGGANLNCQSCHAFANHRVLGRGLDLCPNDRPERLTCVMANCHIAKPHVDTMRNNHAGRIACQTCHISQYAKDMTTETARDWTDPTWDATLLNGQGGYKPGETRAGNLTPTYRWFDGTSVVYVLGQSPVLNAAGQYAMASPNGGVAAASTVSKIYPMKEHVSNTARHNATGQLIPHSTFKYFATGDFDQAVADGMAYAGLTGAWSLVPVHAYQTINHGVTPTAGALDCGECHAAYAGGAPVRMNLVGKLGYERKGTLSSICSQCHGSESSRGFVWDHNKHVANEGYDCSWCHKFSRPERNLFKP